MAENGSLRIYGRILGLDCEIGILQRELNNLQELHWKLWFLDRIYNISRMMT